jgi:hypothetical protein
VELQDFLEGTVQVTKPTSCPGSLDALVDGAPPLLARTYQTSKSPCVALGSSILILFSPSWIVSCNLGTALLGIGIGIDEEGGSGGV